MEIKYYNVDYCYLQNISTKQMVLENINLEIPTEKIVGIIGANGSGKTTFVELLNDLKIPTKGAIRINDYIVGNNQQMKNDSTYPTDIGFVYENVKNQFFMPTVKKEIALGMQSFYHKLSHIEKRISGALKMVGLDDSYLDKDPGKLSNGEMKKVAIASVLAVNPKVIVLDEPTVGLDYISQESFLKMLKILKNRYHKTIIIITKDTDMIHKIADYLFVFYKGKLALEGTKYEVFLNEKFSKLGLPYPKVIDFSNRVLKQKGIKIGYRDDINDLLKDIYRYMP